MLVLSNFPLEELGAEWDHQMDYEQEVQERRQNVLMELFGKLRGHDDFSDPQARDDKGQHKDCQDPPAMTINCDKEIQHRLSLFLGLILNIMEKRVKSVNKKNAADHETACARQSAEFFRPGSQPYEHDR